MTSSPALALPSVGGVDLRSRALQNCFVAVVYWLILLCVWGIFSTTSGMGWETAPTVMSEMSPGWKGFLYPSDPMRIQTFTFYHFAYVLGEAIGMRGSFVPYQITYATLWWARSFLVFVVMRRLFSKSPLLIHFSIGALLLVHAPDDVLQWLGHIGQFGGFLWLTLALYFLINALLQASATQAFLSILAACLFEYMCLWTYEAPFFIVLAAPLVFLLVLRLKPLGRVSAIVATWYVFPLRYAYLSWQLYKSAAGQPYQKGLLRSDFSVSALISDWLFNVRYSLSFWAWEPAPSHMAQGEIFALASGAALVFILAGLLLIWLQRRRAAVSPPVCRWGSWQLLAAGIVFLVLSFPAFLALATARVPWRTQLLSAIGSAMVFGAVLGLIAELAPRPHLRPIVALALAVPIMWIGACRTIQHGGYHRSVWERHLRGMRELLRAVPLVRDGSVVVMTNVPRGDDPFNDQYWFNLALRLAYPRTTVAGIYYYDDGAAGPSRSLQLQNDGWKFSPGTGVAPMILSASVDRTLVLEYRKEGIAKVLPAIPSFVCAGECPSPYNPSTRILPGRPAIEALHRYGPL
jgi:hypothetical protein